MGEPGTKDLLSLEELEAAGLPAPETKPPQAPAPWRRVTDFDHYFSFAEVRW